MPKRSSKKDPNKVAADVVEQATDESPLDRFATVIEDARDLLASGESPSDVAAKLWPRVLSILPTNATAAELGRRGGKKGGRARAEKLSPDERSEIASLAARARWKKAKDQES